MTFQISNTECGYVVEVLINGAWQPIRNFGWRQSDAKIFCFKDCPNLSDLNIKMLVKNYDKNVKFIRIDERVFKKQN